MGLMPAEGIGLWGAIAPFFPIPPLRVNGPDWFILLANSGILRSPLCYEKGAYQVRAQIAVRASNGSTRSADSGLVGALVETTLGDLHVL